MPWHCPACRTVINHDPLDKRPTQGEQFRCHVCRLALEFDPASERLIVAPFENDDDELRPPRVPERRPIRRARRTPKGPSGK